MTKKENFRLFLDLEKYGESKAALELINKNLKSHPDFIERIKDRLYFNFQSEFEQLNFIMTVTNNIQRQGYVTQLTYEDDFYEIKRLKDLEKKIEKKSKRIRTSQIVTQKRSRI